MSTATATPATQFVATGSRVTFASLKPGQFISENQYYKVNQILGNTAVLENERGKLVQIDREVIEEGMFGADYVANKQTITVTAAAAMFENIGAEVLQVNYTKKPDKASILDVITGYRQLNGITDSTFPMTNDELLEVVKRSLEGAERTLTGYIVGREQKLGRILMQDLELAHTEKHRVRWVDMRTLNWFIHKGTQYTISR